MKEAELVGNVRDICLLELMLSAGLRASEVVNVQEKHLEITQRKGTLTVPHAKGNKTRTIPLSKRVREKIELLRTTDKVKIQSHEGYLFIGQRGVLTSLASNKIVEKYAKKAGIQCSPHTLRHTFAYRYLKANPSDIVGLSQILGHSNINTTAIYTQHRMVDLQERVEKV